MGLGNFVKRLFGGKPDMGLSPERSICGTDPRASEWLVLGSPQVFICARASRAETSRC